MIEFSTDEYERTHGRKPRGFGGWAFCPASKYDDGNYLDHCFWVYGKTFAEAKKEAKAHFKTILADDDYVIVCT